MEPHTSNTTSPSPLRQARFSPRHFRGFRFWLLSAVLLAGGALAWGVLRRENATETVMTPPPTAVEVQQLQTAEVESRSEFVGALEAQQRVAVQPETQGQVVQILVAPGEPVSVGIPILQLSQERSQAQLDSAVANVSAARAARNTAEAQLLAAEAEQASAAAEVELQAKEFERTQSLVAQGAQTQQLLDQVERDQDAAIAQLNAAERRVQAAQAALEEAEFALSRSQADAEVVSEDLSDYQVVAPIDGVVGDIPIEIGDYVGPDQTLTTITQNQALELRLSIPIERAHQLVAGLPVELTLLSSREPLVTGQISFISPRVETDAQTILAIARFPNPNGQLRDEQSVRAYVIWEQGQGVLVPTTAISRIGDQAFVFVVQAASATAQTDETSGSPPVVQQRPVRLGAIQGNQYHILDGLAPGETIVTSGILNLSDGMPVTPETITSVTD